MLISDSKPLISNMTQLWFLLITGLLGVLVLSGFTSLLLVFSTLAYVILVVSVVNITRFWGDVLNPIFLIFVIGVLRFSIPGFLLLGGEPDIQMYQMMGVEYEQWLLGHALAIIGILGVVIGWFLPIDGTRSRFVKTSKMFKVRSYGGVAWAAAFGFLIGAAALFVFVRSHVSIAEAVGTGEMRSADIQEGTGKYFYLSLMLISSAALLSQYFIRERYTWWVTFLPSVAAMSLFWILGGRSRAIVPLLCTSLQLWYQRDTLKLPIKKIAMTALVVLPMLSYFGDLYRGGLGMEAFSQKFLLSAFIDYVNYAVWVDWGQLHALAGAIAVGPGGLGGQTFTNMLWPLSQFLGLPAKSAGVFIVQTLIGDTKTKWGFHATLIGDAYLNFGLVGVLLVCALFGVFLKMMYVGFRRSIIDSAFYSLTVVYLTRMFYESIEKFGEALVIALFALALVQLGALLFSVSTTSKRHRIVGISRA